MRRRARSDQKLDDPRFVGAVDDSRQLISALARGLDVVRCFQVGERSLTNREIARRTGLPRPTISRIVYTLRDLGYLCYFPKSRSYGLGGLTYVLGYVADQNFDPIGAIRPIMQHYADLTGTNFGLSTRERLRMIYVESCEGAPLVGLQLRVGDKIALTKGAIPLTYLARIDEQERNAIYRQLKRDEGADIDALAAQVRDAQDQLDRFGFCVSLGAQRPEIHGVTTPITASKLDGLYVLSAGGPAYQLPQEKLLAETGPQLLRAARKLQESLGAQPASIAGAPV
ncbi:MAG TPA: IclR family transcriptional regulator [Sphingomonas sp.]|uniref:IclR family transcriptional regulator n=1 Tax=Sphingomonas sp. TaxID=28214 RepID=UPI002C5944C0|nr:IclR family transcriptional regulator [Sphingomonas sp.]HMI17982.1 IclR family transcriptional regulator [Sphingomonas sp.]